MVDQARALESAQISMRSFFHDNHQIPVAASLEKLECCEVTDATVAESTYSNKQTCYFCGLGKYPRIKCPAREQTCNKCHKKSHYAKVCRFKTASSSATYSTDQNSDGINRTNTEYAPSLAAFESLRNSTVEINLNGTKWKALVDTGSEESFIHPKVVKTVKINMNSNGKKDNNGCFFRFC